VILFLLLLATPVVINEVCYDPDGADGGAEFVELLNVGDGPVDLAGWRLEFANGADGPVWSLRWEGAPGLALQSGARFLIADVGWAGVPADAEVRLGLQNGPDALRLVGRDGPADMVGWGDLADAALFEGAPAVDVAGLALARRPDGRDTGDNAADFVPAPPTPGSANWRRFDPRLAALVWSPPSLAGPDRPATAAVTLANAGTEDLGGATVSLQLGAATATAALAPLPPDSLVTVLLPVQPAEVGTLPVQVSVAGAGADPVALAAGHYQVGLADVRLSEVMAAPAAGGEWCEVHNAGTNPRDLADLAVRDEDGTWSALPGAVLAPGACRLLAQDAAALAAWLEELAATGAPLLCEAAPPLAVPGWPSLNNQAPDRRSFADRLYLGTAAGTVLDHVTLGAGSGAAPAGRSLERGPDQQWRPATTAATATPGCLPPPAARAGADLVLSPNPFAPGEGSGTVRAVFTVPPGAVGWELRVYDLWGSVVRDLGGDDLGPGERVVEWDGRDDRGGPAPAGGYVAVLAWRQPGGGVEVAARQLVVLREARP